MSSIFHSANNVIYLIEVIFYVFFGLFSIFVLFRQGKKNAQGWFSLTLFSLFKVSGSAVLLYVAYQQNRNKSVSSGSLTTGLILSSISLGPLENAGLAFLNQGSDHWHRNSSLSTSSFTSRYNRLIKLIVLGGTILSIVGYVQLTGNDSNKSTSKALVQVSTVLFALGFVSITLLALACSAQLGKRYSPSYRPYILSILIASPFFLVRIVFSMASAFTMTDDILQYKTFSSFNGNWKVRLVMMILMEFAISIIYAIGGFNSEIKTRDDDNMPNFTYDTESQQQWIKGPEA